MSWTDEKVAKLKELWGKGKTANQIAEIIGGISRNAVIGKAHRLNLSAKIKTRSVVSNKSLNETRENKECSSKKGRKSSKKSIMIEKKVEKLKELWGKGKTASQIAEIIGGISRNAVIGKAHRLNLSAKMKSRSQNYKKADENSTLSQNTKQKGGRRNRFKSLIIEKDFEPENPKQLEEIDENSCKWPIRHPDAKTLYFC